MRSYSWTFFDLKRAFEVINIDLLLLKLYRCGVRGNGHSWLREFLTGRTQRVVLRRDGMEYSSELKEVSSGVPQGSLLGPLLFIIFINDIVSKWLGDSYISLFADDTIVACSGNNFEDISKSANNAVLNMQNCCH